MSRTDNVNPYANIDRLVSPRMERVGHHIGGITSTRQKDLNDNWIGEWKSSVACKTCGWHANAPDRDDIILMLVAHKWKTFCEDRCSDQEKRDHKPMVITEDPHPVHRMVKRLVCSCGWSHVAYDAGLPRDFDADQALIQWHQKHVELMDAYEGSEGYPLPFTKREKKRVKRPVFRNN